MQMVRKMAMIKASELGVKKDAVKVQRRRNARLRRISKTPAFQSMSLRRIPG